MESKFIQKKTKYIFNGEEYDSITQIKENIETKAYTEVYAGTTPPVFYAHGDSIYFYSESIYNKALHRADKETLRRNFVPPTPQIHRHQALTANPTIALPCARVRNLK